MTEAGNYKNTYICIICSKTLLLKYQERHMKWHETLSDDRYSFCCTFCPQKFKDSKHLTLHLTSMHPEDYTQKSNTARESKLPAFHNAFLCNSVGSSSQLPISNKSTVKERPSLLFGLPTAESMDHIAHASRAHGMQMLLKLGGVTGLYIKMDPSPENPFKEVWKLSKLILREKSE